MNINNILISKKISSSEKNYKYFIGYVDEYVVRQFTMIHPKTSANVKIYDASATIWMYFLIEDEELLRNIWNKVNNSIEKEFYSEPIYNKEFLKTKTKYYGNKTTNFLDKKMPKVGSNHTCLAVMLIDLILKYEENYYPEVFLKERKYIEKETNGN